MEIDVECIVLLSLILRESPSDRENILCVLARSSQPPGSIRFGNNYPTFYGYSNEKIPYYLMGKKIICNVPREGYQRRIMSSHHLSFLETAINTDKTWNMNKNPSFASQFIILENRTTMKEAEVFLVYRSKANEYIREFVKNNKDKIGRFLGHKLSMVAFGNESMEVEENAPAYWIDSAYKKGSKFIFNDKNKISFVASSVRFRIFDELFDAKGQWVDVDKLKLKSDAGDIKRTIDQMDEVLKKKCPDVRIGKRTENNKAQRCLEITPEKTS